MLQVLFAAAFAVLLGAGFLAFGYRLFLVFLPIWGFFAGFFLGAHLVSVLFGVGFLATLTGFIVGFAAGLVAALFSYLFYVIGVAIVAGAFGYALGAGLMTAFGFDPGLIVSLVGIAAGVVVAGLTLVYNIQKYAIILITSIGGANAVLVGILMLLGRVPLGSLVAAGNTIRPIVADSVFWLLVWLAIAAAGFYLQLRVNREYTFDNSRYLEGWG